MGMSDVCPQCDSPDVFIGRCPSCGWQAEWRTRDLEKRHTGRRGGQRKNIPAVKGIRRPKVVEIRQMPNGPMAYVECPECAGGGCAVCYEFGKISLYRWHTLKNNC